MSRFRNSIRTHSIKIIDYLTRQFFKELVPITLLRTMKNFRSYEDVVSFWKIRDSNYDIFPRSPLSLSAEEATNQFYSASYGIEIRNVILDVATGILVMPREKFYVVRESSYFDSSFYKYQYYPRISASIHGNYVSLSDRSFAHWLIEDAPRFLDIVESLKEKDLKFEVIVSQNPRSYTTELVSLVLGEDYVPIRHTTPLISNYFFSTSDYYAPYPRRQQIDDFVLTIKSKVLETNQGSIIKFNKKRKIFISRKYAARYSQYEYDLENLVISKGYEVLFLEKMKLTEQINAFMDSIVVVGFHGAGLYNAIWCEKQTIVIELTNGWRNFSLEDILIARGLNFKSFDISSKIEIHCAIDNPQLL